MEDSAPQTQPGSTWRVPYALAGFGGALVHDWSHGVPGALQFFPARTWREVVAEVSARRYPRAELAKTLEASGRELGAPDASLNNARLLANENTFAVLTGQQAGFLGGPLLSIHKALTAVKLAREYEKEAGGTARFVPVFWVAGDDHDLAEIDHAYFLRADGEIHRATAVVNEDGKGRSASDVFLSRDAEFLQGLRAELEPFVGAEFLDAALNAYATNSFESAFAALLLKWLGATGLVVARSSDLRRFSPGLLARNVDDFDIVSRLIQESGVAMRKCGYEPGFSEKLRSAPHFFMAEKPGAVRGAIYSEMRDAERIFRIRGETEQLLTLGEMRDKIAREPELCTASAPLRPILQQTIFPVAAAVLGPGELEYWAQLREVHAHYGAVWPVIVPRATLTLIDGSGEKAVRKLGLSGTPRDLFLSKEELAQRGAVGGPGEKIAVRSKTILAEFDAMSAEIKSSGAGLDPMLEKLRQKFAFELSRVAEKTGLALDRSGGAKTARAAYLSALVRPKNAPQERVLCAAQFMAKYAGLPERLLEIIEPDRREHTIVTLLENGIEP